MGQSLGVQNLPIAEYPGVVATDSDAELHEKVTGTLVDNIIHAFANKPANQAAGLPEPAADHIVFEGSLDEVQEFFSRRQWGNLLS